MGEMRIFDKHTGQACRACGSALARLEPQPRHTWTSARGRAVHLATYACTGPDQHHWTYRVVNYDPLAGGGVFEFFRVSGP